MKPDKLPLLDPNVRGIFDLIIETVAQIRKERKSYEYTEAEKRREQAHIALRELRAREAKEAEAELFRQQQEATAKDPTFIPFAPGRPLLTLRESDLPNLR